MFKFDSGYVFLTYPHSTFEHERLHEFINSVCPTDWLRVATEQHADGDPHVHAVGKFVRRFQSRNERIFDYDGRHPNIQSVRSVGKAVAYVAKDGQFTDYGAVPTGGTKRTYQEAISLAGSANEGEYLTACLEARMPHAYAKRFRELAFSCDSTTITDFDESTLQYISDARLRELQLPENKCAVLIGPTGCGKSIWAKWRAPKPALWVTDLDVLKEFKPTFHKSIIFDDMTFRKTETFNGYSRSWQIYLADWNDTRTIRCRHTNATIPANTVKIFTGNEPVFSDDPAIDRRLAVTNLYFH